MPQPPLLSPAHIAAPRPLHLPNPPFLPSSVALSLRPPAPRLAHSTVCQRNIIHFSLSAHMLTRSLTSIQSDRSDERTSNSYLTYPVSLPCSPSSERYKYFCGFLSSGALRGIGRRINIPSMVATLSSVLTLSPFFSSRREMQAEAGREGELRRRRRRSD